MSTHLLMGTREDHSFSVGDRVRDTDKDDADPGIVIECLDKPANKCNVDGTEKTVAEFNEAYDATAPVVSIAFEPRLEEAGAWRCSTPSELQEFVDARGVKTYSYPAPRLSKVGRALTDAVTVWFDGACEPYNPGGHGTWGFVVERDGETIAEERGYIGQGDGITNNVAEYTALIEALEYVRDELDADTVHVHGDSQLAIRQLTGRYNVNSSRLQPLWHEAQQLAGKFDTVHYQWVPREQNEDADALSKQEYEEQAYADRLKRARNEDMAIEGQDNGTYLVKGDYTVDTDEGTCTCPDHQQRNAKCKHQFAVELTLDQSYTQNQ